MHTYPLEAYMVPRAFWGLGSVAELMIDSAVILARCGAGLQSARIIQFIGHSIG
ncbi:MAG: hypothetical protein CM1200mP36_07720 [Gammaproteobacteria bacterium]|nr:MAG: hypothetical protein CM1200mP36_07720 [Gammaproteobacteria bacterium]